MLPILRLFVAKLPSHTPLDPLPCPGGHSDEHLWKGGWQTPLLYPSGNRRKPLCFAPGEKKESRLNGDYSFGKRTEEARLAKDKGIAWDQEPWTATCRQPGACTCTGLRRVCGRKLKAKL